MDRNKLKKRQKQP